jgi:ABC-2 type transport system ATP-binding protein
MITLDHLTKTFHETIAVNDVSYDVRAGEIFGIIGPDGAGKTTTLRVISTAMLPTRGKVSVDGHDVVRDAEIVKSIIGYMPQRFALYPDLTVVENLNFFADLFGSPRQERAALIERLLGFARLNEFKTRYAQNLSGGMQKKLALASTLMHRPRVLLLDEPTTGLDPVSRREFWDLLTNVHLEGVTIVVSTPYLDEAERCTRVALMHRGKLIACDEPNRLRAQLGAFVFEGHSEQARAAEHAIEFMDGVLNVNTYGDVVRVILDDAARRATIQNAWQTRGIAMQNFQAVSPRLEDVFVLKMQQIG